LRSIAIVSSQAFSIVNFRASLIEALVRTGAKVYAFAPDYTDGLRGKVTALGAIPIDYELSRTSIDPVKDLRAIIELRRNLRRLRPDVALTYFVKPVIYGSIASRLAGVPRRAAMIEGLGFVFMDDPRATSLRRRALRVVVSAMYRFALRLNHRVFFLNSDDLDELVQARIVNPQVTVQLDGIGVDLEHFCPMPPPGGPVIFVMVARMLREKGVYDFVDAARRLKAESPHLIFRLVGDIDPNPGSIDRKELMKWHDEGLIEWTGHVEDVRPHLQSATAFVLPSYREGLPRSTQEAMACGRAIVTTDVPGCRDTVVDGINGYLVPPRDPSALAAAMSRLAARPSTAAEMGVQSRQMAERRFDARAINRRILAELGLAP